ncbi:MAG: hypothetical protein IKR73_08335 [Oscillospiraceae bacterium]|nr:hypothetical protein [Oscillospiraceae bacterium]
MLICFIMIAVTIGAVASVQFMKAKEIKELKDRCLLQVPAECTFLYEKIWRKKTYVNVRYTFEYNGETYRGSNTIWGRKWSCPVEPGDMVWLYVNTDCLPDDIYDPAADRELHMCRVRGLLILLLIIPPALTLLVPDMMQWLL